MSGTELITSDHSPSSVTGQAGSNANSATEVIKALINLSLDKENTEALRQHIASPFDIKTPPEKVKKRPDGYDYVEGSYMDFQTKQFMPLYRYSLVNVQIVEGWINVIVSLEDRITGNVELGADSARIQVKRDAEQPTFRDIIDMGNNLKSALSKAIKNAQSRFGISADIYGRRESAPTDLQRERFESLCKEIKDISPARAQTYVEQWKELGTDWDEFMDKWQIYVERNRKTS
jgi:hypothetical protein